MSDSPNRPFAVGESEYPFKSHWLQRDGTAMYYIDEGQGLHVILLYFNPPDSHSTATSSRNWMGLCHCIAPEAIPVSACPSIRPVTATRLKSTPPGLAL